jgi:hypothetical protein
MIAMDVKKPIHAIYWLAKTHGMLLALVIGIILGLEIALL